MGKIIKILQRVLLKCQFLEVGEIIKILETLISWLLYRKQKRYNQQRRQKKISKRKDGHTAKYRKSGCITLTDGSSLADSIFCLLFVYSLI